MTDEYRYALEMQDSPFPITLNPTEVHDHVGVYIYRITPLPVTMTLVVQAGVEGPSYVEVFDADNERFLLTEKTEINGDAVIPVEWDGRGVFEVRVWKDSLVESVNVLFALPDGQLMPEIAPEPRVAPIVLIVGCIVAVVSGGLYTIRRKKR